MPPKAVNAVHAVVQAPAENAEHEIEAINEEIERDELAKEKLAVAQEPSKIKS